MVDNINKEPDTEITSEKMADFIQKKQRGKAVKEFFNIIGRYFFDKSKTWFTEFSSLEEQLKNIDLASVSKENLENYITTIEKNIQEISDIKKDLKLTYILSQIKNQLIKVNNPSKEMNNYQLFAKNISPGSIILFNKKVSKKDKWAGLLRAYDQDFDTDFIHSAIISNVNENWSINILHSTTDNYKTADKEIWVREEPLKNYFKREEVEACDFIVLEPDTVNKEKMLEYAKSNIWKWYDSNAAIWDGLYGKDLEGGEFKLKKWENETDDELFNCVEIIAKGLDIWWIKNITQPNEFLRFMEQLKPSYMTTIESKEIV